MQKLTIEKASSSHTKYTSLVLPGRPGGLLEMTGGGPIDGPPVLGPEEYMWLLGGGGGGPPTAVIMSTR